MKALLHASERNYLRRQAALWLAIMGGIPCEAVVRDYGCPGCCRPCVVVTFAHHGQYDYFVGEYSTTREAAAVAKWIDAYLTRRWAIFQAARGQSPP